MGTRGRRVIWLWRTRGPVRGPPRPPRVSRRYSRENRDAFAIDGADGAASSAGLGHSKSVRRRSLDYSISVARAARCHPDYARANVRISAPSSLRDFSRRLRARELRVDAPKLQYVLHRARVVGEVLDEHVQHRGGVLARRPGACASRVANEFRFQRR